MYKFTLILLVFALSVSATGQELSGSDLLEKAIQYHDPHANWNTFNGTFMVTMSTPDRSDRESIITINRPGEYFRLKATRDSIITEQILDNEDCILFLNGRSKFTEREKETHRLNCDRAKTMKDYYTYLYGLPMKLRDPGTRVSPKVLKKQFKGKDYLVLKVTYEASVGEDTWYFYFNPDSYAMEVYQFYHEEDKNDGEYIILKGEEEIEGIKMPKIRSWYYNKDDKFLGTDTLSPILKD